MAEAGGIGALSELPEVNLARRLLQKHGLVPPVDVLALVAHYAEVTFRPIPVAGVDGVSVGLKISGQRPQVVVNSAAPARRQRFTLAHELGHLVIPWHVGTIPDMVDFALEDPAGLLVPVRQETLAALKQYAQTEQEANRFASELLMPTAWMRELITRYPDLAQLHRSVAEQTEVSPLAAARQLEPLLPPGIVFFGLESDSQVKPVSLK